MAASTLATAAFRSRGEQAAYAAPDAEGAERINVLFGTSTAVDEQDPRGVRQRVFTANTDAALVEGGMITRETDGSKWKVQRVIADGRLGTAARLSREAK